jgi:hypothetical protein
MTYVEDVIENIGYGFSIPVPHFLNHNEHSIMASLSDQVSSGQALTEKQAMLAIRLLDKYKNNIRPIISDIDSILTSPKWKYPFRKISSIRKIDIEDNKITVEFPYSDDIVTLFRTRNSTIHELHRGLWDAGIKKWKFSLTEKNVLWIIDSFKDRDFQISEKLLSLYNDINVIRENVETYVPMLSIKDGKYTIVNGHRSIPQPDTINLTEALFHAKNYGITVWDEEVSLKIKNELNSYTKVIIESSIHDRPWFNSDEAKIDDVFGDLLNFGGPLLVIVPGGSEYQLVKEWSKFALSQGILSNEMSVMFRLPNNQADFNQYIKENGLNTPVDSHTKIVFVSTKITKPLIKSGINFRSVINLGYYNYMHFSMATMVDNVCNLVYYNMKAPNKTKWLPHEL